MTLNAMRTALASIALSEPSPLRCKPTRNPLLSPNRPRAPAFIGQSKVQWPLLGAIIIVLIILYAIYRIDWKTTRAMLAKSVTVELVALVYGLMLLNVILENTGAIVDVREFLLWCKVPVLM